MEISTRIGVIKINHNGGCSLLNGLRNFIASPQKLFSILLPINKSLNKKPAKIAPIDKIIKGLSFLSFTSSILVFLLLYDP